MDGSYMDIYSVGGNNDAGCLDSDAAAFLLPPGPDRKE